MGSKQDKFWDGQLNINKNILRKLHWKQFILFFICKAILSAGMCIVYFISEMMQLLMGSKEH